MKLKYLKKRLLTLWLVSLLSLEALTGCGSNKKIVFTTGLSGNQIFKIGDSVCRLPELMIYLTTFYTQYADTYGKEMWDYDFGGVTLEDHVKEIVLSKMTQIKVMNLMADERGIILSEEEKKRSAKAAEEYYARLNENLKKEEDITLETAETVYREYTLANKVYATITEAADMEISDDEARTIQAQIIFWKNWKMPEGEKTALSDEEREKVLGQAREALERIRAGEGFETVAAEVSEEKQLVWNYARGDVDAAFEEILFSLDEGEVSDVIETADGIYIVKCISTMDDAATRENKQVLAERRKQAAFSEAYEEVEENTHSQFRDRIWEKVTLQETYECTDANFFEIYEEYVKQ